MQMCMFRTVLGNVFLNVVSNLFDTFTFENHYEVPVISFETL